MCATLDSTYGTIISAWQLTEESFCLQVTVPPNAHATVRIPANALSQVTESDHPLDQATGVTSAQVQDGAVEVEIGAGRYDFVSLGLNRAQAMANVRHVAGRLDVFCSLRDLLADERSQALLLEALGQEVFESPRLDLILDQPLDALARFAPQALTPERLQALQQALLAL